MTASVLLIKALGGGWSVADLPSASDMRSAMNASPCRRPGTEIAVGRMTIPSSVRTAK